MTARWPRRAGTVTCTRSLLIRGPNGYARAIQEGEQVRRGDPITRSHRAYFARRRWRQLVTAPIERTQFDPKAYPLARRLRWRYGRKTMRLTVSPSLSNPIAQRAEFERFARHVGNTVAGQQARPADGH